MFCCFVSNTVWYLHGREQTSTQHLLSPRSQLSDTRTCFLKTPKTHNLTSPGQLSFLNSFSTMTRHREKTVNSEFRNFNQINISTTASENSCLLVSLNESCSLSIVAQNLKLAAHTGPATPCNLRTRALTAPAHLAQFFHPLFTVRDTFSLICAAIWGW